MSLILIKRPEEKAEVVSQIKDIKGQKISAMPDILDKISKM
jgi:hypothetical protein